MKKHKMNPLLEGLIVFVVLLVFNGIKQLLEHPEVLYSMGISIGGLRRALFFICLAFIAIELVRIRKSIIAAEDEFKNGRQEFNVSWKMGVSSIGLLIFVSILVAVEILLLVSYRGMSILPGTNNQIILMLLSMVIVLALILISAMFGTALLGEKLKIMAQMEEGIIYDKYEAAMRITRLFLKIGAAAGISEIAFVLANRFLIFRSAGIGMNMIVYLVRYLFLGMDMQMALLVILLGIIYYVFPKMQ